MPMTLGSEEYKMVSVLVNWKHIQCIVSVYNMQHIAVILKRTQCKRRTALDYLFSFFQIRQHYDGCRFLFPYHPPEVSHCLKLWA